MATASQEAITFHRDLAVFVNGVARRPRDVSGGPPALSNATHGDANRMGEMR